MAKKVVESQKPKTAQLVAREKRDGTIALAIRHGGRAARMFLLDQQGTFVQVVGANEYPTVFSDQKVARSRKGLGKGKLNYLSSKAQIKAAMKEDVTKMVKSSYPDVAKLFTNGKLKVSHKAKVEIIPLI